jgi:thiamine biosynthesis lipoprotein
MPPARRFVLPAVFVAALFVVVFLRQPDRSVGPQEYLVTGPTMGTTFTVKVVAQGGDDTLKERLAGILRDVLEGVDGAMSTYRTDSEIAMFNRHSTEDFEASPELMEIMAEAQRVARLSGGAFDITVGPLVNAWGFGPLGAAEEPPSEEALHRLLAVTGFELIEIDPDLGVVRKARAECRADLSAIAKGFAVDRVAAVFDEEGFQNYMVEIGGEVRTRGRNGAGKQWRIGIERPDFDTRAVFVTIPLSDLALATSGDYRNYVERNGVRISHTIDPRTGHPIAHGLASVSVIHSSCTTADALATALEVLGPVDGLSMAEQYDIPAFFLVRIDDNRFKEMHTDVWTALTENRPASELVE